MNKHLAFGVDPNKVGARFFALPCRDGSIYMEMIPDSAGSRVESLRWKVGPEKNLREGGPLFRSFALVCVLLWTCSLLACAQGAEPASAAELSVQLDHRPFQQPHSTFVQVAPDGAAEMVIYSPHRLEVLEVLRGQAQAGSAARLLAVLPPAEVPSSAEDAGLRHGDLFLLRILEGSTVLRQQTGLVDSAPAALQQEVQELLRLRESLGESHENLYFLRVEELREEQARRIRGRGRQPVYSSAELPAFLSNFLSSADRVPGVFRPIEEEQYDALLQATQAARLVYVTSSTKGSEERVSELSLYLRAAP